MGRLEVLYPYPALKLSEADGDYLVISDLHIGFEERFNTDGFRITPSTDKMLQTLTELIRHEEPDRLIILGDVKSGFDKINRNEWRQILSFMEKVTSLVEVSIIRGNHDGSLPHLLPHEVRLEPKEILLGGTALLHGHTTPSHRLSEAKRLIIGHIHPSYNRRGSSLSGSPVWLTLRAARRLIFGGVEGGMIWSRCG